MSRTRHGRLAIRTGSAVGRAGEAVVFTVWGQPDLAFKRYYKPTLERMQKLEAMIASPPSDPTLQRLGHRSIAWPLDLVEDAQGRFEGFTMPLMSGTTSLATVAHPRDRRRQGWDWTWRHLIRVAANLSSAVAAIHRAGYVIGDVNTQNILVNEHSLVTVIDCDSMQIPGPRGTLHRCPVGTPDYLAPELADQLRHRSFADIDRTPDSDNFALAVLIYTLLFEGNHPYAAEWRAQGDPPDRARRMREGLYAHGGDQRVAPPPGAPPLDISTPELRSLCQVAFVDGARHPSLRPTGNAWHSALTALESQLTGCAANPNHTYASHRTRCPWCERIAALGVADPFPAKGAHAPKQGPQTPSPGPDWLERLLTWLASIRRGRLAGIIVAISLVVASLSAGIDAVQSFADALSQPTQAGSPRTVMSPATVTTPAARTTTTTRPVQPITDGIVFTRRVEHRRWEIVLVRPDGAGSRVIRSDSADVAVSPDGKQVAYSQFDTFGWRLYVAAADGTDSHKVCADRPSRPCRSPSWSPDGKLIAYMCGGALCIVGADGGDHRAIHLELDEIRDPSFSPDGRYVVLAGRRGLDEDLFVLDLQTGQLQRLTDVGGAVGSPAWSRDGHHIAFTRYEGGFETTPANIYIVGSDGAGLRAVTSSTDARNTQPSWAPEGDRIVFVSDRNHLPGDDSYPPYIRFELFVVDVDGSNLRRMSKVDARNPQWVP